MEPVIEATNLTRFYGKTRGVQQLDLAIAPGAIVGLLGENGCGKTTALKLAMGRLAPDDGRITTLGCTPTQVPPPTRARIGYMADDLTVPGAMCLKEAMNLQALYFPTWSHNLARELCETFQLKETQRYSELSLGQKRRFMLLLVLAQMPELLVLDEPASGLDPAVRRQFIDVLIGQAASRSMTIVISSHILSDLERLVDTVAFMKAGRVLRYAGLDDLRASVKRLFSSDGDAHAVVVERFQVVRSHKIGTDWQVVVEDFLPEKLAGLNVQIEHLNLEELFIAFNEKPDPLQTPIGAEL